MSGMGVGQYPRSVCFLSHQVYGQRHVRRLRVQLGADRGRGGVHAHRHRHKRQQFRDQRHQGSLGGTAVDEPSVQDRAGYDTEE